MNAVTQTVSGVSERGRRAITAVSNFPLADAQVRRLRVNSSHQPIG